MSTDIKQVRREILAKEGVETAGQETAGSTGIVGQQSVDPNYVPKNPTIIECSIEKTMDVIGGKWSFLVLRELFCGTRRFGELQRKINAISPTALTNTLRHLEVQGVLERQVFPTIPVKVEYTLTPKGEDLHMILKQMKLWAAKWT